MGVLSTRGVFLDPMVIVFRSDGHVLVVRCCSRSLDVEPFLVRIALEILGCLCFGLKRLVFKDVIVHLKN